MLLESRILESDRGAPRRLKSAKLRHKACIEDIDYRAADRRRVPFADWRRIHCGSRTARPFSLSARRREKVLSPASWRRRPARRCSAVYTRAAALVRDLALARADGVSAIFGDRRLGHGAVVRNPDAGLLRDLRGPLSGALTNSQVAVAGDPLA